MHAECVQFEAFAREVLVEAAMLLGADGTVGAYRPVVIEVVEHGRVPHDRFQQIHEASGDMRPDGFLDIGAIQAERPRPAARRNGEVVGPEPDQTLPERKRGGGGMAQRGCHFPGEETCEAHFRRLTGIDGLLISPVDENRVEHGRAAGGQQRICCVQLPLQPSPRVGRQGLGANPAKAEAPQRVTGFIDHGAQHSTAGAGGG